MAKSTPKYKQAQADFLKMPAPSNTTARKPVQSKAAPGSAADAPAKKPRASKPKAASFTPTTTASDLRASPPMRADVRAPKPKVKPKGKAVLGAVVVGQLGTVAALAGMEPKKDKPGEATARQKRLKELHTGLYKKGK